MSVQPFKITFLLVPGFSMIALYSALEPLRVANRFAGEVFSWDFASLDGEAVTGSNAIPVSVSVDGASIRRPNLVLVCSSYDHVLAMTDKMRALLRRLGRAGIWLGGVDTGPVLLADAGLLDGRQATCHWETLEAMREDYPKVEVADGLFAIDGPRLTSSGGTAPLDMMLALIRSLHGGELATRVADSLVHARMNEAPGGPRIPARARYEVDDPLLLSVIAEMESHLEDVLRLDDLAAGAGLSKRQLERRFKSSLGLTPMRFYLSLRLERAEHLLAHSRLSVRDVAIATGFSSLAEFSRSFKKRFGHAPSRYRTKREVSV